MIPQPHAYRSRCSRVGGTIGCLVLFGTFVDTQPVWDIILYTHSLSFLAFVSDSPYPRGDESRFLPCRTSSATYFQFFSQNPAQPTQNPAPRTQQSAFHQYLLSV